MRETEITNLQEAKEHILKKEPSMNELISIDDVNQDVDSWDNVDKDRLADRIDRHWTYPINHPYASLIEKLAIKQYIDDMQRVPMDDLNPDRFQGIEDMIVEGYWPYQTTRDEIKELVYEWKDDIDYFHEYENEVLCEINAAIDEARLNF